MFRRTLALLLLLVFILPLPGALAEGSRYTDTPPADWPEGAVERAAGYGLLEDLGEAKRRITGEGYFTGEGCRAQWRQLQAVFRRGGPGSLQLPGQEPFLAVMDSLKLLGAPGEELIHYSFGFTEHRAGEAGRGRGVHTAQAGESLWDYARRYEKTMEEMIAANPHIRDIAVLEDGEEVRVP